MATSTTTIRTTTTTSGVCAAESDTLYSFRSLHDAYMACRKRKRNTINALRFEASLLDNLFDLRETLAAGTYKPARSVCFVARQPKHREIFAADFRDRVVHHLLVPQIEKVFEPKFIHDSYACRKGKGTHAAVARLRTFMNRITKGGRVYAWFMQLDIRSFFMSIDRGLLLRILSRHIRDARLLSLAETIVLQDCTKAFVYKGDRRLLQQIPPHKSLFHIPEGKGLPIGNLTSQFFGNVYLNELDQFVKHVLKAKFYLRYVDDFIILHQDKDALLAMKERIEAFLEDRLALELKPGMVLKRVSEGADFLGYIVRPDYVLVRNRVVGNLSARLRRFEEEMVEKGVINQTITPSFPLEVRGMKGYIRIHLREDKIRQLRQTLASYLGHFKHANAYRLVRSLFEKYRYLDDFFAVDDESRLQPLYEPPFEPASLRVQYKWAVEQCAGYCLFFQVGRFCEFYGEQAARYGGVFGLKLQPSTRNLILRQAQDDSSGVMVSLSNHDKSSVAQTIASAAVMCGFPMRYLKEFKKRAMHAGLPFVVVGERGCYPSGLKKRVITEIYRVERRMI